MICDDCPGGTDWEQRAVAAEAQVVQARRERDAARRRLQDWLDGPPAEMSYNGRLVPINSAGMREVIDEAVRLGATVVQARRERDAALARVADLARVKEDLDDLRVRAREMEITEDKCRGCIDRLTAERDAAHAAIRRLLNRWVPEGNERPEWVDYFASRKAEPMSPAEVDAIKRARETSG